jgi:hypothetical protein
MPFLAGMPTSSSLSRARPVSEVDSRQPGGHRGALLAVVGEPGGWNLDQVEEYGEVERLGELVHSSLPVSSVDRGVKVASPGVSVSLDGSPRTGRIRL